MNHYHRCTECFVVFECELDCTIILSSEDDDKFFGSHCKCFLCEPIEVKYDQQWFAKYNGFVK